MSEKVSPVPEGFRTVTPHLIVKGVAEALDFYASAFGAEEILRMPGPDGQTVMHAEIKIGDSMIMMCEEHPDMGARSPVSTGGTPVTIHLYVDNADTFQARAVAAGASEAMPVQETFWGDRYGKVVDPFGHNWSIATHVEDLSPEEIGKRCAETFGDGGCAHSGKDS